MKELKTNLYLVKTRRTLESKATDPWMRRNGWLVCATHDIARKHPLRAKGSHVHVLEGVDVDQLMMAIERAAGGDDGDVQKKLLYVEKAL